ncbi:Der1-like family-domain-containing protein [Fennellomyces sp. T-0311]|nr:Der1-like family-domain-containing protein [Fennellomyces sp. T-0311]
MPSPIETWYTDIPPITRIYITASCLTSLAVQLGFVHPLQLWLNYDRIIHGYQWWRLLTNFLYFGPISIDFLFHMFFLARYSRMMEEGFFRNKPADYVWLLLFSAAALILCSTILPFAYMPFLGSPLAFTMVYIWARRNPYVRLNFLGLLVFSAPHLPWVLLCFSLLLSGQLPMGDLLGIAVGHIYYFFEDIWPRDPASHGRRWLETPRLIRWLIDPNRQAEEGTDIHTNASDREDDDHEDDDEDDDTTNERRDASVTTGPEHTAD